MIADIQINEVVNHLIRMFLTMFYILITKLIDNGVEILTNLRVQQLQEVENLKLLVPKRVKMSDGSMRIWRCPEELIPMEEFSPMDIGNSADTLPRPEPTGDGND